MAEQIRIAERKAEGKAKSPVPGLNKSRGPEQNSSYIDRVLHLQRTIGNRAVTGLIKSGVLQASLKIGQPGDIYEKEADRIADQVMLMPEPGIQRKPPCPECEEEKKEADKKYSKSENEKDPSASELEKLLWKLSPFSDLSKKLIANYQNGKGKEIKLTKDEMLACKPFINIKMSEGFLEHLGLLTKSVSKYFKNKKESEKGSINDLSREINIKGQGGAKAPNTLGNYTVNYRGRLCFNTRKKIFEFNGTVNFYDWWNFDKKSFFEETGRSFSGELKVRFARLFLTGNPFPIYSVDIPIYQNLDSDCAEMIGGPKFCMD